MLKHEEIQRAIGHEAYSESGEKLGKIDQIYLDDQTGRPEFMTTKTGLFGTHESCVPIAEARMDRDHLTVPFEKSKIKDAPHFDTGSGHLSQTEERKVYQHYGMPYSGTRSDSGLPAGGGRETDASADAVGRDVSGPTTDEAMTRSEEQLDVGTRSEEVGQARLRKYVETEHVTQTVPVEKERVVLEREPITDTNRDQATAGPDISEEEHEVTLHEERPVVSKHAEPLERVRLAKTRERDQVEVSEDVRKERIETEGDIDER